MPWFGPTSLRLSGVTEGELKGIEKRILVGGGLAMGLSQFYIGGGDDIANKLAPLAEALHGVRPGKGMCANMHGRSYGCAPYDLCARSHCGVKAKCPAAM